MRHAVGKSLGGELEQGILKEWEWTKNKGGYAQNRDFFCAHWEVQVRDRFSIRLHVEAPKYYTDPFLNDLKQEMIGAILSSDVARVIVETGYQYKQGRKISASNIQNFKCTEPFRVVLTSEQRKPTTEQDIEAIHQAIGAHIDKIVQKFTPRLDDHFYSQPNSCF